MGCKQRGKIVGEKMVTIGDVIFVCEFERGKKMKKWLMVEK